MLRDFCTFSPIVLVAVGTIFLAPDAFATGTPVVAIPDNAHFVGATTCQSSMCHGGATQISCQYSTWSQQDFHSRAYATLTTPRSVRMAQSLSIPDATSSTRCTICHAPFQTAAPVDVGPSVNVTEGVSCEHCHNAAGSWLRGHTRLDWTYADRIHAGMRDLRSAQGRANTCVSCHQALDPELVKVGHPELTFELDGQSASEPRHWVDKDAWFGPKAWLVGQATALREISTQLTTTTADATELKAQARALVWVLEQVPGVGQANFPDDKPADTAAWSNQVALSVSKESWKKEMSTQGLTALAGTGDSFVNDKASNLEMAIRAERLVLGLDRLSKSLDLTTGQNELTALFGAVQDREHFDPREFSKLLHQFSDAVSKT